VAIALLVASTASWKSFSLTFAVNELLKNEVYILTKQINASIIEA